MRTPILAAIYCSTNPRDCDVPGVRAGRASRPRWSRLIEQDTSFSGRQNRRCVLIWWRGPRTPSSDFMESPASDVCATRVAVHNAWKAGPSVFLSTRHFAVYALAVYRTSILLIIRQITSKNPITSRHFLYVPLRSSWLPPLIPARRGWNLLESVRTSEKR